jgi:carbonic anhydrase/acetyltransferase-like protein (isoleucine patch superfamily)
MIIKFRGVLPKVHPTALVHESAQLIGSVQIGEQSSVWFGAVLRGDLNTITIGNRSNIQDNCTVHVDEGEFPTTIGDEVTVGHNAILHGCKVCDRVIIGMGSIILDGAEVGEDCIIGAGALVPEGTRVPPRTLFLGLPAKQKRSLTDADLTMIRDSARHYVEQIKNWRPVRP